ncbi:MAG: glutamate formimidoyltransferase [Actinomycetota bacterium]
MRFVAVPNVSEGRDPGLISRLASAAHPARVLDVHSDRDHNRTVLTLTGTDGELVEGCAELATASLEIDLTQQEGAHPRLGVLDVCPIVPIDEPTHERLDEAARVATRLGAEIARIAGLPVYLYGAASRRPETDSLPVLRTGGLERLRQRSREGLGPDFGPHDFVDRSGVACIGARGPLIAFNVMLDCDVTTARAVASHVRTGGGGPHGLRALGLWLSSRGLAQVSMNLIDPQVTGIETAFDVVASEARSRGARVVATELVGLPPERFMPGAKSEAARILIEPGRSLEEALQT